MDGILPPEVSVLVATRGRPHLLRRALASVAAQTLHHDRFEVVVVVNGERDGTPEAVAACRAAHPSLTIRTARSSRPGVAHASSVGLLLARGRFVTVLDDDDTLSPRYLETLLAATRPGVIALAWLAETEPPEESGFEESGSAESAPDESGPTAAPDLDNYYSRALRAVAEQRTATAADGTVAAVDLPQAVSLNVGKLVPTATAREVGYDHRLRSGADFVFWTRLHARTPFRFALTPPGEAVYLRSRSPGSVSRQEATYDFAVTQRLDCVAALDDVPVDGTAADALAQHMVVAQLGHVRTFLAAHPDRRDEVVDDVEARGLTRMDWTVVNRDAAQDLALLYCFPPWTDTAGVVGARRIRERGLVVDVVCHQLDNLRPRDASLGAIAGPLVGRLAVVPGLASMRDWSVTERWSEATFERLRTWGKEYRSVYSRAMWPASHLVAAQYKHRHPATRWVAEFSDPLDRDIHGESREGPTRAGAMRTELVAMLGDVGVDVPVDATIFSLAEWLPYAYADEILFTNENQRDYMLSYCPFPALAARARDVATVRAHPTLAPRFYELGDPDYALDDEHVHLGYFGVFYATRSLSDLTLALHRLPGRLRRRVRLHVFTVDADTIARDVHEAGLSDCVVVNPYLGFLDFLALTRHFDVLVVNDAVTRAHAPQGNPYLPSKVSDYLGSGTDIWAIVEPGSVTSRLPFRHRSELGDTGAAYEVLVDLVRARFGDT